MGTNKHIQNELWQDYLLHNFILTESILCYYNTRIQIEDKVQFFIGDHPSQSFERGTQSGGGYPCGGCGVRATMIDDQPHALRLPHRQFSVLQTIGTEGHLVR